MMVIHNRVEIAKHQHHTEVCHLHHSGNNNMKQQEQQEEQKQQQQKQLHHHENALPSKALEKLQKSRNKTTHTVTARLPPYIHMHVRGECCWTHSLKLLCGTPQQEGTCGHPQTCEMRSSSSRTWYRMGVLFSRLAGRSVLPHTMQGGKKKHALHDKEGGGKTHTHMGTTWTAFHEDIL